MAGPQMRVLLVEPNEADYALVRRLLLQAGPAQYHLEWVRTYPSALDALERGRYDVCLTEQDLGERTGLALIRTAGRRGHRVPMILVTAQEGTEVDRKALELGAAAYLEKRGLRAAELDRCIRYGLAHARRTAALLTRWKESVTLHRLTDAALHEGSAEEAYAALVDELAEATGFPLVCIEEYDAAARTLTYRAVKGLPYPLPEDRLEVPVEDSISGDTVLHRRPRLEMWGAPPQIDEQGALHWLWVRTFVCLPLVHGERVVGALTLAHPQHRAVDSIELNRAATLASHVARLMVTQLAPARRAPVRRSAPVRIRPGDELRGVLPALARACRRHGLELCVQGTADAAPTEHADPQRLREVLTLFLGGAVRFAAEGKIRLDTAAQGRASQLQVSFDIRDRNGALANRTLNDVETALFIETDPQRAHDAGLQTCRRLADRVGGTLEVRPGVRGRARILLSASYARSPRRSS